MLEKLVLMNLWGQMLAFSVTVTVLGNIYFFKSADRRTVLHFVWLNWSLILSFVVWDAHNQSHIFIETWCNKLKKKDKVTLTSFQFFRSYLVSDKYCSSYQNIMTAKYWSGPFVTQFFFSSISLSRCVYNKWTQAIAIAADIFFLLFGLLFFYFTILH